MGLFQNSFYSSTKIAAACIYLFNTTFESQINRHRPKEAVKGCKNPAIAEDGGGYIALGSIINNVAPGPAVRCVLQQTRTGARPIIRSERIGNEKR
jgi:hypothetical protein